MKSSLENLENKFVQSLYEDVLDTLFNSIRDELIRTGKWHEVGEENLGEMVSDVLNYQYLMFFMQSDK